MRRGPFVLVLAAWLAAALGTALAMVAVMPVDAQGVRYVLVRRDAFLHAAPNDRSERARDPWAAQWASRIGPVWVLRLVDERDGWLEVATVPAFRPSDHCYPTIHALRGLDLRMFVRASDVSAVTARRVTRSFDDGASMTLVAGVAVTARNRNRYDAFVRGATVRTEIDAADVAAHYQPGAKIAVPRSALGLLAAGARIDMGRGLGLTTERAGHPRRGARTQARRGVVSFSVADTREAPAEDGPPRASFIVEGDAGRGRTLASVRNECVEIRGPVDRRSVTNERPSRAIEPPGARTGTSLRAGTAIYWPDGALAGRVTDSATLDGSPRFDGSRACFDHPLREGASGVDVALTLCVDRSAIASRRRRSL